MHLLAKVIPSIRPTHPPGYEIHSGFVQPTIYRLWDLPFAIDGVQRQHVNKQSPTYLPLVCKALARIQQMFSLTPFRPTHWLDPPCDTVLGRERLFPLGCFHPILYSMPDPATWRLPPNGSA